MSEFVTFKIKPEQKKKLKNVASELGMNLAIFCRIASLEKLKHLEENSQ